MKLLFFLLFIGFVGSSSCGENIFNNNKKAAVHIGENLNREIAAVLYYIK